MGEIIRNFLNLEEKKRLKEIGERGDRWRKLLEEAGGDESVADLLAEVRGDPDFGILDDEKPKLEAPSPRVAAQMHANRKKG
ncbi:MAG: hypothetical protein KatS3mg088_405 [Patescibacteria group bacterium]|nr:MAG: hypothetical protein KatS3mg088_405 [Patescibacteria group bacterium]